MTDATASGLPAPRHATTLLAADPLMQRRNRAEARFRAYGVAAICVSLVTLMIMLFTIFRDGTSAFRQAYIAFPVTLLAKCVTIDQAENASPRASVARKIGSMTLRLLMSSSTAPLASR